MPGSRMLVSSRDIGKKAKGEGEGEECFTRRMLGPEEILYGIILTSI